VTMFQVQPMVSAALAHSTSQYGGSPVRECKVRSCSLLLGQCTYWRKWTPSFKLVEGLDAEIAERSPVNRWPGGMESRLWI